MCLNLVAQFNFTLFSKNTYITQHVLLNMKFYKDNILIYLLFEIIVLNHCNTFLQMSFHSIHDL